MLHVTDWFLLSGIKGFLYLDPSSGSVILQVIIALVVGIGITVRVLWTRIKSLFSPKKPETPPEHEE